MLLLRWRRIWFVLAVGIFEAGLTFLCVRQGNQIRFDIMRPIYMREIALNSGHPRSKDWYWSGGPDFDDKLVYVRDVSDIALVEKKHTR